MVSLYKHLHDVWKNPEKYNMTQYIKQRMTKWRRGPTVVRVVRPTRLDRARSLGYKAKQGIIVVRVKVRRGSLRRKRPILGRRQKRMGFKKLTPRQNLRWIAEMRGIKKYPNLEVLNSYFVGKDGKYKYYEIIMVDPHHPAIKNDSHYNWICSNKNKGRVFRGLTSAGKKARGMRKKGKGAEKIRPSARKYRRGL